MVWSDLTWSDLCWSSRWFDRDPHYTRWRSRCPAGPHRCSWPECRPQTRRWTPTKQWQRAHASCYGSTADRRWQITGVIADRTNACPSRPSAHLLSLLTSRVLLNLYSNDHMTRVTWHLVSERSVRRNTITPTKTHSSSKQAHLILSNTQ